MQTEPASLAIDGGRPTRTKHWPTYDTGDAFVADADIEAAIGALRSRRYFRYDCRPHRETETAQLEDALREFFDVPHVLACSSGTAALALSLLALGLPPGSPIACPAFTFAATPSAIMLAGHRPVLVECDDDLHVDVGHLRERLAEGVSAVVVVHMRGFASDMPAVCAAAEEHGVPVVEDAVPALGARLAGRPLGTFGTFGAFSTQSDKSLNTGEGGFLVTADSERYARAVVYSGAYEGRMARHLRQAVSLDDRTLPLFSMRMDEIRAALAAAMLRRLPERLSAHRRNYDQVAEGLATVPGIALRRPVAPDASLGEAVVFRLVDADAHQTAWFAEALRAEGVSARALADPADRNVRAFWHWRFLFDDEATARATCPRTAAVLDTVVDVPLSANLGADDCAQLVAAVAKVANARTRR